MVTIPVSHDSEATVSELRRLFDDEHVHMALLLDGRRLAATVERPDVEPSVPDDTPGCSVGSLRGRTVAPEAPLADVFESMQAEGRRRLAVTNEDGELLGVLCLKASGLGFCSDADVESRKRSARY
jgi:CBS domain-containing protein